MLRNYVLPCQQAKRDPENDLTHEIYESGYDISSPSEGSFGKFNGRAWEQELEKTWYGFGRNTTYIIFSLESNGHGLSSKHSLHKFSILMWNYNLLTIL